MSKSLKQHISDFLTSPSKLFWFFMLVNMIPSLLLVFTEPLDWLGKAILIVFPIGLYFILLSLYKNIGLVQLLLFPLLFLHAFQIVLFYLFGESVISVDMYLNLATTNASEAGELLDGILPSVVFVVLIYIPTTVIAIIANKKKVFTESRFRKTMILSGITLLLATFGFSFVAGNTNRGKFVYYEDVYPVNIVYNLGFAINKWNHINNYPQSSKDFTFAAHRSIDAPQREIYVMVVGETGRADNWSLYGYERETTPYLQTEQGLVFYCDAITQANATHKSVPIILSTASAEDFDIIYTQKSIFKAFSEVGFTTVFLSNQAPNHSFADFYAQEADFQENIRPLSNSGAIEVNNLDEALLPILKHYIDSVPDNLFVVLHTYGSHFNYKERYPVEFARYQPDNVTEISSSEREKLINAYDNSILYTDHFLYRIIEMLKDTDACTAIAYTSDHGEDIMDDSRNRFLHASPNPTYYQLKIPLFAWFSENYQSAFPLKVEAAINNQTKPVSTNAMFHTMLDMASIETKYLEDSLSLVNSSFKVARRMYLDNLDNPVFYYNANLKKQDKEMIEKRGMHH